MTKCQLTDAEINHLRRLLAYVDCEIGQSPEEMIAMAKKLAPNIGTITVAAAWRMEQSANKAAAVPLYVRAAVKALQKTIVKHGGEVVDVSTSEILQIGGGDERT